MVDIKKIYIKLNLITIEYKKNTKFIKYIEKLKIFINFYKFKYDLITIKKK